MVTGLTIMLCRTLQEAERYRRSAGLRPGRCIMLSSENAHAGQAFVGIQLREDDLIVEFPGFRDGRYVDQALEVLKVARAKATGAGPEWTKITGTVKVEAQT